MPELPDIEAYRAALESRIRSRRLETLQIVNPFILRSVTPEPDSLAGRKISAIARLGKRLVFAVAPTATQTETTYLILHLMIAGRLRWLKADAKLPSKLTLAALCFEHGKLAITEAGTKRRASLHLARDDVELAAHDPGGIEPLECDLAAFTAQLRDENRTLKRILTDPRRIAGIGNAFSDEILHAAGLSPVTRSHALDDAAAKRLFDATRHVLSTWVTRLSERYVKKFPAQGEVTAFRPEFAVHGKFGAPCPVCSHPVQRIRYAENETNYCPTCQTGGRVLADRSLSRLLKDDWPRSIDTWEQEFMR